MRRSLEGSPEEFKEGWRTRKESLYTHWTRGPVQNQIQFAFRQHWELIQESLLPGVTGRCLEVGCGRGSISSYFSDHGWDCSLLDISGDVIRIARDIFEQNGLEGKYMQGDALRLPLRDASFDCVISIGLLEHFVDVETCLEEQVRVLAPGGLLIAYIVPEMPDNVQRYWRWLNSTLAFVHRASRVFRRSREIPQKPDLFRSDDLSDRYTAVLEKLPVSNINSSGIYPVPMISHSVDFPFTIMPKPLESLLVRSFGYVIARRRKRARIHPWLCDEGEGQAILVWCTRT